MSYNTKKQPERNKFIENHMVAGRSMKEVQQLLIDSGYDKIGPTRIWRIWKRSDSYIAKRTKIRVCNLCHEAKAVSEMNSVSNGLKMVGKICDKCWNNIQLHRISTTNE